MKKAVLRTYIKDYGWEDEIVEVYNDHSFKTNSDDTAPFLLNEGQFILPLNNLTKEELIKAIEDL